jgi:hypothetical protein
MDKPIVNRVANSNLMVIDLEDFYPQGKRERIDISEWLFEGVVLKEKEFRKSVDLHDWSQYKGAYIALDCSTDAIIPGWAFMLISIQLAPYAKKISVGSIAELESLLFSEIIESLNLDPYEDKSVIIKGCSNKPIPQNAYVFLAKRLQPIARKIMYGEACSAVPLFKK